MLTAVEKLNIYWEATNKPQIGIRIGINTGTAVIGNVGSEDRLSYTALGDSVNLTQRLEDLNKQYQTKIIISHATLAIAKDQIQYRLLDYVVVRGKHAGVYIYEILPEQNMFAEQLDNYNTLFNEAFKLYEKGEWDQAHKLFSELAKQFPQDQLINIYIERCDYLKTYPQLEWHGMWSSNYEPNFKDLTTQRFSPVR
jgi:adenylate cyclase